MSDYGVDGMPKVVVLGGTNHLIYLNKNDDKINYSNVHAAISAAITDGLSSIDEQEEDIFEIKIYPNPTTNILNISYSTKEKEEIEIEIIDPLGKSIILKEKHVKHEGLHHEEFNLGSLKNGVYFIKLSNTKQEQVKTVNILN
jgi:microcompartment protein CcmL/EutN